METCGEGIGGLKIALLPSREGLSLVDAVKDVSFVAEKGGFLR